MAYLPKDLLPKLDWSSIKLYKMGGQHIESKTQKAFESDLIYLANFAKEPKMLWIHIEHQSTPDRRMFLRILNYQTAELLAYATQNPKEKLLPGIISLIYHQGSQPWPYELDLKYQFKDIDFYEKYFGKPIFIDLPAMSDEALKNHQNIGPVEVILKYVRQKAKTLELKFPELVADLDAVDDMSKVIVLKYVVDFLNLSGEEVIKIIQECLPKSEGIIMNAREEWTQEGIKKGMQQGMQQGMQKNSEEIALNMLTKGLCDQLIQEVTQLSNEKICELKRKVSH